MSAQSCSNHAQSVENTDFRALPRRFDYAMTLAPRRKMGQQAWGSFHQELRIAKALESAGSASRMEVGW
jgi:hypothetical protein